jgi:hypothetical protein
VEHGLARYANVYDQSPLLLMMLSAESWSCECVQNFDFVIYDLRGERDFKRKFVTGKRSVE